MSEEIHLDNLGCRIAYKIQRAFSLIVCLSSPVVFDLSIKSVQRSGHTRTLGGLCGVSLFQDADDTLFGRHDPNADLGVEKLWRLQRDTSNCILKLTIHRITTVNAL